MAVWHKACYDVSHPGNKATGRPAKFEGTCKDCGAPVYVGSLMTWSRRQAPETAVTEDINGTAVVPAAPESEPSVPEVEAAPKASTINDGIGGLLLAAVMPAIEARLAKVEAKVDVAPILADIMARVDAKLDAAMFVKRVEVKVGDKPVTDVGVQHKQFPTLVKCLAAKVNVWLAGPSGSGKTTAAIAAAKALGLEFRYTGAVGDPYALTGYNDAQGRYVRTPFRETWENGGLFLWDEVDASDPNALLAFNAALANGHAAFPDGIIPKHPDCVLIAAANTFGHGATHEYVGRLKLDAAFLKRFAFLSWEYDESLELATCPNKDWCKRVQAIRAKVKARGIRVLVTPRESYIGADLLAAGIEQSEVENMTIRSGMTAEQWEQVL